MTITAEDRAALLDHDRRFFDALVSGDVPALERLLADDFVLVSIEDGAIARPDALLGLISSGSLRFPAIESFPEEAIVRRIGDTGIVVGRTAMNFTGPDGGTFTASSRYTHVFARTPDGTWHLHSAQGTTIRP
ncbi:YybH family protein [Nonomuraea sp. NPDC050536]|uniref:YybH family protein n=1 Tax=Nonomuraea sp. NPDC050536 TaxID=3364366 RepID=UPI0037C76303